mmetsp:Transcript_32417/g.85760  ORF Transcript_32417/g.85760 Transcript_32417/m.85760 type:complete len:231 (-) Transcript_32417:89-781(-)
MGSVDKKDIEQRLKSMLNDVSHDTASIRDLIDSGEPLLSSLLSIATSNACFPEPCAELAAALRDHLDNNAPCELICELMTACQNEFETLLSSLDIDDLVEPYAIERKRRLANLMAFIGHLFRQRAIRGNSIIHSVLNVLLCWDLERSRWRGQPKDFEVSSACALLSTVRVAYVGKTPGSRVYLSRLKSLETAGPWSETTRREIAALIHTWEQEWVASSRPCTAQNSDHPG